MDYHRIEEASAEDKLLDSNPASKPRRPWVRWLRCVGMLIIGIASFFVFLLIANALFDLKRFILTVSHTASTTAIELEPQNFKEYGARRVKQRMGPFVAPGTGSGMNMMDHLTLMPAPCTDCVITLLQAGLEYEDGTIADTDTGLWLHHGVLTDITRMSITCPNEVEKIFASGNERAPLDLTDGGRVKTGYYFGYPLHLGMGIELMNENQEYAEVYFTMTFEYVPEPRKSNFTKADVVWLDVSGCSSKHEVEAKPQPVFHYNSKAWTSIETHGRIVLTAGHLHDAGSNITLMFNDKPECDMVTSYGTVTEKPGRELKRRDMDMDMDMDKDTDMHKDMDMDMHEMHTMKHIVDMTSCANHLDLNIGDTLSIKATYDTTRHPLLEGHHGGVQELMGITMVFVDTGVVAG